MVLTRVLSYILTSISILLQVVVHTSPGWTVYRQYTSPISVGLWIICTKEKGCHSPVMDEVNMNVVRGFMTSALVCSFISLIWSVEWNHIVHCELVFVPKALAAAFFNFLAGICLFIALVVFECTVILETEEVPAQKKWAYYLSFVIFILSFATGILDCVSYKYMLWGIKLADVHVAPEEETANEIEKQNLKIPRLL